MLPYTFLYSFTMNNVNITTLLPILFCFYVMGFVDLTGVSVSYVKNDFALSDTVANIIPMMVFLWFAILSIPLIGFMNRKGRKKTVLLSAIVTTISMLLPMFSYTYPVVLTSFALLGIGNTILQVSLNPLLSDVSPASKLTSMLTLGQFIKAIASTLGPILISLASGLLGDWKYIFPVYAFLTGISWLWLMLKPIKETEIHEENISVLSLLKNPKIILFFSVIMLSVGFEIGLITTVPKYLQESFGMSIEQGSYACSLYYIARTIGTFVGSIFLIRISAIKYQVTSVLMGIIAFDIFLLSKNEWMVFVTLFLVGLLCANIFSVTLSTALQYKPDCANEVSSLMITGVSGGAIIPPIMGLVADHWNQAVCLIVPLLALIYILYASFKFKGKVSYS